MILPRFSSLCLQQRKKNDFNLIKSYLLPLFVNERGLEPIVIKKANQIVSFMFGDVPLLDILNFLKGTTSLDSFLITYNTSDTATLHMNVSIIQKSSTTLNFHLTKPFSAYCATKILSKKTNQTFKL